MCARVLLCICLCPATPVLAIAPGDDLLTIVIPLETDGHIDLSALVTALARETETPIELPVLPLRLPTQGVSGGLTRTMLQSLLGDQITLAFGAKNLELSVSRAAFTKESMQAWKARLGALADRVRREAQIGRAAYGMRALPSYRPNDPSRPTVCLIHGMNSASGCFVHMIPLLEQAGYGVVLYDFPDNQDLDRTAPQFANDWAALRKQTGERAPWAIAAHSMGGLLAREYVEGERYADDVSTLVLIAPPNHGSALAKAQGILQLLQNVQGVNAAAAGSLVELGEGLGEAADDLVPGSAFLKRLNSRKRRASVKYHILAGDRGFLTKQARRDLDARMETATRAVGVFGKLARLATSSVTDQLDELTDGIGDGAVSVASTRLEGVAEPSMLHANHVELIRGPLLYPEPGPVACMPLVLEWLQPLKAR